MSQQNNDNTLTIVLATTIPVLFICIVLISTYFLYTRRRGSFFRRGVTPIADEEIESWKLNRTGTEKETLSHECHGRAPSSSVSSVQKPASVIVYQYSPHRTHVSDDFKSPTSMHSHKRSMEGPQSPVLARAPNSRPGLTDETVQGDDAFISPVKRYPSRLAKSSPGSPRHVRTESNLYAANRDYWYGSDTELQRSPRRSADTYTRKPVMYQSSHRRVFSTSYSTTSGPPPALYSSDDDVLLGGLSPPPVLRKSEIGRAIG
ncbi:hypothetical protein S40285_01003 [Stachybotrys chlorohalonatus IBT 40285]|uniref:Uncharacterized protein n=1 Tax=Stachybotrys chlorohalonatus (strain IBT 40285) TaxID=1283841 RepID=A0A084QK95_STAC4|nr:hypothetical protein S40285_01003 [Stachybotrys chlorohalonata IBT 40285]